MSAKFFFFFYKTVKDAKYLFIAKSILIYYYYIYSLLYNFQIIFYLVLCTFNLEKKRKKNHSGSKMLVLPYKDITTSSLKGKRKINSQHYKNLIEFRMAFLNKALWSLVNLVNFFSPAQYTIS